MGNRNANPRAGQTRLVGGRPRPTIKETVDRESVLRALPGQPKLATFHGLAAEASARMFMPQRTPLYDWHVGHGARMVDFAGWDMPVQYSGIIAEHHAVRTKAGLFDLSHMGEVEVSGPRALEALQELVVTDVARVQLGQAQYSVMCYPDGGIVDDIIIYRVAQENYLICVNASNIAKDFEWMTQHNHARATMIDRSDEYALIAVQGPTASAIVRQLTPLNLSQVRRYWFATGEMAGVPALVARTGSPAMTL